MLTRSRSPSLTEIPDHLLAEIFLRLPAAEDLARASAACVSFRQLVAGRSFLRSFRRLHAPPLLGLVGSKEFHPVEPSHPSASAARALALAADFSFSFLPSHCRWAVQDIRDGRVLLHRQPEQDERPVFTELVVCLCDPLHRRHVLLPPVPDDLAASVEHSVPVLHWPQHNPFLLPLAEEAAAEGTTTFTVICLIHCKTKLSAFVFDSSTGQWRVAASKAWSDFVLGTGESDTMSRFHPISLRRHYAYGCFYWDWLAIRSRKLLVLDTRRMEFSMADAPPGEWGNQGIAIVEAGEGRPGMFYIRCGAASDLISYTIAGNKGESPSQWRMEKTIPLDSGYKYYIRAAVQRHLILMRTQFSYLENPPVEYFVMDIKTLQIQRNLKGTTRFYGAHIYANFPPSLLSSPAI